MTFAQLGIWLLHVYKISLMWPWRITKAAAKVILGAKEIKAIWLCYLFVPSVKLSNKSDLIVESLQKSVN